MKTLRSLAAMVPLVVLIGCSNPADNVAEAVVAEANPGASLAAAVDGKHFLFGPESSRIDWIGSKVTGHHDGGFHKFAGELTVVDGRLADHGNKVLIDMTSVWSDNDRLTGHLKTGDFFEVEVYPTATFVTTAVEQTGSSATVTGHLTLRGITKEISFPARIEVSEEAVRLSAEFFINRFDFGVEYAGRADDLIRKEVVLKLDVRATPGRADFEDIEKLRTAAL